MIFTSHTIDRFTLDGVTINRIIDSKFKTGSVSVRLFTPYNDCDAPAFSLLPALLCSLNRNYPSQEALTKRLNELYGGNIWGSCSQLSDMLELSFSCDFILDRYAIDGEPVSLPTAKLLVDCLLDPLVVNGGFDPMEFSVRKQDLLDAIDSEINERSAYALTVAYETIYRGENSAKRHYYSREAVEALTPEFCYNAYLRLLENSRVFITVCSGEINTDMEQLLASAFSGKIKNIPLSDYYTPSPAKAQPEEVVYPMDVKQASIVLAFKTACTDYYAIRLMSMLYGESPTSMLSLTVREAMSLCYYCQSGYSETKGTMVVVSGVDYANIPAVQNAVVDILSSVAKGEFDESTLEEAKLYFVSRLRSRLDRKGAIIDWYLREELTGSKMTIDDAIVAVNAVTRERVMSAAGSFKLDTLFTLGKEPCHE